HIARARGRYAALREAGITAARERASWRRIEAIPGRYDFCDVGYRAFAARDAGVELLWTCMDADMPDDVDPAPDAFIDRFAAYCAALATYLRPFHARHPPATYTVINQLSRPSAGAMWGA